MSCVRVYEYNKFFQGVAETSLEQHVAGSCPVPSQASTPRARGLFEDPADASLTRLPL